MQASYASSHIGYAEKHGNHPIRFRMPHAYLSKATEARSAVVAGQTGGVPAPFPRFRFENNWNKWNMFIKPQRNGQKVCSNSDFANWNNWNKPMPHPFCTSAHIQPPPAGRPPLHRANARCTWALEYPPTASEAF